MNILIFGFFLIALAFLIHLAFWRIRLPKRQTRILLLIFFGTYFSSIPLVEFVSGEFRSSLPVPQNIFDYAHVFLFFTSFTLAYIITYSALEVDSPSLVIVKLISEAGSSGFHRDRLEAQLSDEILVIPRINDLLRDRMAFLNGDKLNLTLKGKWFVRIFIFYRFLLNARTGG